MKGFEFSPESPTSNPAESGAEEVEIRELDGDEVDDLRETLTGIGVPVQPK